jgi:hypothetical protein
MKRTNSTRLAHTGTIRLLAAALLAGAPATAEEAEKTKETKKTTVGFELDALPYLSGGWYGSAWVGRDRVRIRPVVASTELPSFLVEEGFSDAKVEAYALIVDWFFRDDFRGFWVGAGAEYWKNGVTNETDGGTAEWSNTVATVGGGYVWKISGNLYVNPWIAGHLIVGGPTSVTAGGATYHPKRFSPEASVKLGWHF